MKCILSNVNSICCYFQQVLFNFHLPKSIDIEKCMQISRDSDVEIHIYNHSKQYVHTNECTKNLSQVAIELTLSLRYSFVILFGT